MFWGWAVVGTRCVNAACCSRTEVARPGGDTLGRPGPLLTVGIRKQMPMFILANVLLSGLAL